MSYVINRAAPMKRVEVRRIAWSVRDWAGFKDVPYLPIVQLLESLLDRLAPGFVLHIADREKLGPDHACTDFGDMEIRIRQDVYEQAIAGSGRDRGTCAHELGHAILHVPTRLSRIFSLSRKLPAYEDPEWQAKVFAAELLVDSRQAARCKSPREMATLFGVSAESARVQWDILRRERTPSL